MDKRNEQGLTEKEFIGQYDSNKYDKPSVAVDLLIFAIMNEKEINYRKLPKKAFKILMIKRKDHPFIGQWALPGGFVRSGESVQEAATRELKEETSVKDVYLEQLYTWGEQGRDPRTRVISCSYMSLVDGTDIYIKSGDDAVDAAWFNISYKTIKEDKTAEENGCILERNIKISLSRENEELSTIVKVTKRTAGNGSTVTREILESKGVAFDHGKLIGYGIERLRNKIEYTDIAFSLMPELFTLTELQHVYETILDKELLAANFRRKVAHMVIETDEYTKDAGHRPSKLYRFNTNWEESRF